MAFDKELVKGFGRGTDGSIVYASGQINSYAKVTAVSGNTFTIGTASNGVLGTFVVGRDVLLSVCGANTLGAGLSLGNWVYGRITAVNGSVITLDTAVENVLLPAASLASSYYCVQAIVVAEFADLTLNSGVSLSPPVYSVANGYGGILAFKCSGTLTLAGGAISLTTKGIPVANKALREAFSNEASGVGLADTDLQAGMENFQKRTKLTLNSPDGTAFIVAKTTVISSTASRIGNTAAGVHYNRGGATKLGAPTVFWVSGTITGFSVSILSNIYSASNGAGLGGMYIASDTKLPQDDGVYTADVISDKTRLLKSTNIKDFGDGSVGALSGITTAQLNSYAKVSAISSDGLILTLANKSIGSYGGFDAGARVVFHASKPLASNYDYDGAFWTANILAVDATASTVTLDSNVNTAFPYDQLANYACQLISVPKVDTLTLSNKSYTGMLAWSGTYGRGGLAVIMAKTKIDLSATGMLLSTGKGLATGDRSAYAYRSNTNSFNRLPISEGSGAIMVLTDELVLSTTSRLGNAWTGKAYGGKGNVFDGTGYVKGGGYKGADYLANSSGSPAAGGTSQNGGGGGGIDGQNGKDGGSTGGKAGASLFVVANKITGFNQDAFSTGGEGGKNATYPDRFGSPGGAGYGGGGAGTSSGYAGAGGGIDGGGAGHNVSSYYSSGGASSGVTFIYANEISYAAGYDAWATA